jgi:hypothetical protein
MEQSLGCPEGKIAGLIVNLTSVPDHQNQHQDLFVLNLADDTINANAVLPGGVRCLPVNVNLPCYTLRILGCAVDSNAFYDPKAGRSE